MNQDTSSEFRGGGRWVWATVMTMSFPEDPLDLKLEGGCNGQVGKVNGIKIRTSN